MLHDPWRPAFLALIAGLMTAGAAVAETTAPKAVSVGEGALLAGPCAACHGTDGRSPGSIPAIHGRPADAVAEFLLKYRSGELKGTVMNRIAAGFTPEQIKAIADHFGAVK
ncbi:hypothetical protein [Azospirillum sp.]|uniref:c-type cytochrome n=1 Tax=Azospirillum sp. TaxID=34012 RepID=UPI002D3F5068|nr:hypothetical protein [Azospirillum sp.]HYD69920.1 hypothetical protein [Azospirillum sp.]